MADTAFEARVLSELDTIKDRIADVRERVVRLEVVAQVDEGLRKKVEDNANAIATIGLKFKLVVALIGAAAGVAGSVIATWIGGHI